MSWLIALISGLMAGLAYPARFGMWQLPDLGFLGFFCWVPLMMVVGRGSAKRAFYLSAFAALFHFTISQYWLYTAINHFGGLSPALSILVLGLLILVLSAYFGLIFLLSQWVCLRLSLPLLWVRPIIWVGIEYLRHLGPMGGYPWSQLGYTQGGFLTFMQSADLWGAYGITFLLVLANELLANLLNRQALGSLAASNRSKLFASFLLFANLAYGLWVFNQALPTPIETLSTGIVQGNVAQEDKWQRGKARQIFQTYVEGTRTLVEKGAKLILWPEASMPMTLAYNRSPLSIDFGNGQSDLIFGAVTREASAPLARRNFVFNSALLLNHDGEILEYYHKRQLVPFGEYVPYKDLLFFAKKLTAEVGDLQAGAEYRPIRYGSHWFGILICYEDIFPYIARKMVSMGANVLINLTNDAWYGISSAPHQHLVYGQMRSIENRRASIRAANTGISSQINIRGEIQWQGALYRQEIFLSELPLYEGKTLFVRVGYLLPHIFLIILAGMLVGACFKCRSRKAAH